MWPLLLAGAAVAAWLLFSKKGEALPPPFTPGRGNPAAQAKVGAGAMVGVALLAGQAAIEVPAHVLEDSGSDLRVIFDVGDEELAPTPTALAGRTATVPRSSVMWAVFSG